MRVSISSLFFGIYFGFVAINYGEKYVLYPLAEKFFWVSKMQTKLHEGREKKWMISCDFFCLSFDWSRGYGEEKNPVLTGIRHSGKNSSVEGSPWVRKIVGTLRWKTRVTGIWLVERLARVFQANYSARQSRTFAIIDYFLSLNQRGSRWQVSNLL